MIMQLRTRCHLYYAQECDTVYHPSMPVPEHLKKSLLVLSDSDMQKIVEVYQTLLPLHKAFKKACREQNLEMLAQEIFFEDTPLVRGEAYEKLRQYKEAKESYIQAAALNPDDPVALFKVGDIFCTLSDFVQAESYLAKSFALAKDQTDPELIFDVLREQGATLQPNRKI